jgi:hypothetical protein
VLQRATAAIITNPSAFNKKRERAVGANQGHNLNSKEAHF